jgi:malonate transporter
MGSVNEIAGALAPVFLLILIGWGARAAKLASSEAFAAVNRLGYTLLYPAFLFTTIAGADVHAADAGPFVAGALAGFASMAVIALAVKPVFGTDGPAFTSLFQGALRWNGFAVLAAAPALFGRQGGDLVALAFGPAVLLVNLISVAALARWGASPARSWRAYADQVLTNPLILACGAGLMLQALGVDHLGPVQSTLDLLAKAAMPIALICVGAGLNLKALRASRAQLALTCVLKLLLAPVVMAGAVALMGGGPIAIAAAAAVGATPTAAAAYTLAKEMGGDHSLMAAIITATTLVSFLTMPVVLLLAQAIMA